MAFTPAPASALACAALCAVLAGCGGGRSIQPDVSPAAILERMTVAPAAVQALDETVTRRQRTPVVRSEEAGAEAAPLPPLSLADAIALGLEANPRLKMAAAALARADGQEIVAFAPFLPELDFYSRYGATSANLSPGAPGPVGGILADTLVNPHSFVQAELGLQWTIWDFGRTSSRYGQAVSRHRIAKLQLARAEQTIAFDVSAAYVNVLLAQASRLVQEQAIRQAEATLQDAKARRQGGVADRDDVLRAEVQVSVAQENLVMAQEAEFAAIARLNHTLGRNAALPVELVDWQAQPRFERSLVDCLQTAVEARQEVRAAQEAVAVAQGGLDAAEAEFLPRIYIRADVGHVDGSGIRTGWQEGMAIHLDHKLYAGRRRQGEEYAAAAEVRAAVASAQSVFDTITLEVNLAYRGQRATQERIRLTEPAVTQARENLRLVRVKYKNGNATPTDVVDAETTATRAQQRYYAAIYDHLTALARLEYAMGTPQGCLVAAAAAEEELLPRPRVLPAEND